MNRQILPKTPGAEKATTITINKGGPVLPSQPKEQTLSPRPPKTTEVGVGFGGGGGYCLNRDLNLQPFDQESSVLISHIQPPEGKDMVFSQNVFHF